MSWYIIEVDPQKIVFGLQFTNKELVSTDALDRDTMSIKLLKKDLFIGARSQKTIEVETEQAEVGFKSKLNGESLKSRGDE